MLSEQALTEGLFQLFEGTLPTAESMESWNDKSLFVTTEQ
jgi:hypothetical protein